VRSVHVIDRKVGRGVLIKYDTAKRGLWRETSASNPLGLDHDLPHLRNGSWRPQEKPQSVFQDS
jgi:hypothetical protein